MQPEWWERYEDAINNYRVMVEVCPISPQKVYEIRSREGVEQFFRKIGETPSYAVNHFKLFFLGFLESRCQSSTTLGEASYTRELLNIDALTTIENPDKITPTPVVANPVPKARRTVRVQYACVVGRGRCHCATACRGILGHLE